MKKVITLLSLLVVFSISSQNLSLDTTFGSNGLKRIISNGDGLDVINFIDYDQDSFLIYSKIFLSNSTLENVVYKINVDGTFDNNFGVNGTLILPEHEGRFFIHRQSSNHLIVFFTRKFEFDFINNERIIMRYDANGNLDDSFGVGGEIRIAIGAADGTGTSNISILQDDSILFSDSEKFIKYDSNGIKDLSYGIDGVLNSPSIGNMTDSNDDDNIFFYNSLKIEKSDSNNDPVNSFGTNGDYDFPEQRDYLLKSYPNKLSFMEFSDLPAKFYVLNTDGTLDTNFNSVGSIDLTTDNDTLLYYENFDFTNDKFYFSGSSTNEKPVLVCYDKNGNLVKLNNQNSYEESLVNMGAFSSVINKNGFLFACIYEYDETNETENFIIAKYDTRDPSILSTSNFENAGLKISRSNNFIEFKSTVKVLEVKLIDLSGKTIKQLKSNKIETKYLSSGIYIAHLKLDNNKTEVIKIFIE